MKFTNISEDKLPLNKLNHLRLNLEDIERLKNLVSHLNNRRSLIKSDDSKLSDFEKNERQILGIKTEIELAKTHANILKREMYVADHKKILVHYLTEMDKSFDVVQQKLAELKDNKEATDLTGKYDPKTFEQNWEMAIDFYVKAKALVYPQEQKPEEAKMQKVN